MPCSPRVGSVERLDWQMGDIGDRNNRESGRRKVILAAVVIVNGQRFACQVRDLSAGGAKVWGCRSFAPGTPVHLELARHGRFPAVVVWAKDEAMGLAFPETPGLALARFGDAAVRLGLKDEGHE